MDNSSRSSDNKPLSNDDTALMSPWLAYKRLLNYIVPYWGAFILAVLGYFLFAGSQPAFAALTEYMIDSVDDPDSLARYYVPAGIILIFIARGIGFFLGNYGIAYVARRVMHDLRLAIFDQLLVLPAQYYHQHSSGSLLAKLTFNVEQITGAATDAIKIIIREGLTVLLLISYLLYLNWSLTLVFFLVGPAIGFVVMKASKRFRRVSRNLQNSMGDVTASANESIKAYEIVRVFGGQSQERWRFTKASNNNRQQAMKLAFTESIATPIVQMIVAMAMALLIFLALQPNIIANMSAGKFIAFITAAGMLTKPIRSLTEVNSILQQGIAAAQSLFAIIDSAPEQEPQQPMPVPEIDDIIWHNVNFSYAQQPVLKDINFTLPKGKWIALVGPSGSGKSTLVNLLLRFYQPQQGQLTMQGQNINQCSLADWRKHIALVNQQVILFNGTIAENIAYGDTLKHTPEAIYDAAKAACVTQFSDALPNGLDTQIGEAGVLLSGGQKQRIALARALLKNAPILVLDEATSALDTESEKHIQTALDNTMQGRTTLVIAHRLSTIEKADMILVLDKGTIVEQGNHAQLLQQQGLYAHLYTMQYNPS